jgi:hypothetical protein
MKCANVSCRGCAKSRARSQSPLNNGTFGPRRRVGEDFKRLLGYPWREATVRKAPRERRTPTRPDVAASPARVTHDVDEAMLLADRIIVMKEGRIADDRQVALARPRTVENLALPEAVAHKEVLLRHLGLGELVRDGTAPR